MTTRVVRLFTVICTVVSVCSAPCIGFAPTNTTYSRQSAKRVAVDTAWVYKPKISDWTFCHHQSIVWFKGQFVAIYSNARRHEAEAGERVLISTSKDFFHWSEPRILATPKPTTATLLAGSLYVNSSGVLIAYIGYYAPGSPNVVRLYAKTSADGRRWSELQDLHLPFHPNQGPVRLASGRLILPGNFKFYWSDNPSGLADWHSAGYYAPSQQNIRDYWLECPRIGPLCEGSPILFGNTIHMMLRSQSKILYVSTSTDNGRTYNSPRPTTFSNDDSKFQFGRLSDGRYFYLGNPTPNNNRSPLVLSLSNNGTKFTQHFVLGDTPYKQLAAGNFKMGQYGYPNAIEHNGYLYIIVSRQKEAIQVIRVRVSDLH